MQSKKHNAETKSMVKNAGEIESANREQTTGSAQEPGCPAEIAGLCGRRHWAIYWLIIIVAVSLAAGKVLTVRNYATRGESPFFSANDRSRWCTVHSLVDYGTFEIDEVISKPSPIHWDTIDKVQHIGRDGRLHYYSSKPPLLSVIVAGQYWLLQRLTGWNLAQEPLPVARVLLLVTNVLPFGLMLWCLAASLERIVTSDWSRYFVLAAAGFGTFLTTYVVTFNNHLPAAVAVMGTLLAVMRITGQGRSASPGLFLIAGAASGFAAACDLPALALAALTGLVCGWHSSTKTALGFVPALAAVGLVAAATNYWAHGMWELAYSHRSDGAVVATVSGEFRSSLDNQIIPPELAVAIQKSELGENFQSMNVPSVEVGTWMGVSPNIVGRWAVRDQAGPNQLAITTKDNREFSIHRWNNWYDYPGSYWSASNERRSHVDLGESSKLKYAFHMSFGHHGLISLTPLWILAAAGMLAMAVAPESRWRWLGLLGLALTVVVFLFYLTRPVHDRNYGGMTSGLRWAFWLIPIWLVSLAPAVNWLSRSQTGRWICLTLLGISIVSAGYSAGNPWVHPWLYEVWDWTGLPK